MPGPSNGSDPAGPSGGTPAERVADLAIELLKAARALGDAQMIAAAEVAAFTAAVALAKTAHQPD